MTVKCSPSSSRSLAGIARRPLASMECLYSPFTHSHLPSALVEFVTLYPTSLHLDFIIAVRRIDCKIFFALLHEKFGRFSCKFYSFRNFCEQLFDCIRVRCFPAFYCEVESYPKVYPQSVYFCANSAGHFFSPVAQSGCEVLFFDVGGEEWVRGWCRQGDGCYQIKFAGAVRDNA